MSLCPNISAAVAAGVAPAAAYASSPNDAASPALRSTTTDKPAFTSRPATSGVKATRRSLAAVSFGTPMFMNPRSGIVNDNVIRRPLSVIRHPWATGNYGRRTTDDVLAFRQRSPLPRLRQQAFGEVEPLRQLAHLRLEPDHAIFQVRHTTLRRAGADHGVDHGIGDLPPRHAPPIAITEIARGDHDDVVQVPDPHPTQGEAHPDAALGASGVEAVQPERAAQDRQPERHAARTPGERGPPRAGLRRLQWLVPRHRAGGHVTGPASPARASSRCRRITPVCRPTS